MFKEKPVSKLHYILDNDIVNQLEISKYTYA